MSAAPGFQANPGLTARLLKLFGQRDEGSRRKVWHLPLTLRRRDATIQTSIAVNRAFVRMCELNSGEQGDRCPRRKAGKRSHDRAASVLQIVVDDIVSATI